MCLCVFTSEPLCSRPKSLRPASRSAPGSYRWGAAPPSWSGPPEGGCPAGRTWKFLSWRLSSSPSVAATAGGKIKKKMKSNPPAADTQKAKAAPGLRCNSSRRRRRKEEEGGGDTSEFPLKSRVLIQSRAGLPVGSCGAAFRSVSATTERSHCREERGGGRAAGERSISVKEQPGSGALEGGRSCL